MANPISKPVQLAQNAPAEDELIQMGIDPLEVDQMISENNPYEDPVLNEQFRQSALKSYTQSVTNATTPQQPPIQQNDASIYDAMLRSMGDQEKYAGELKKKLEAKKEEGGLQYLDLRPFAQSLRSYGVGVEDTAPPVDREATMQALQDKIQQATSGLTKQQVDYLRAKALQAAKEKTGALQERKVSLSEANRQDRIEQRAIMAVKKDPIIKDYNSRIQQMEREKNSLFNADAIPVASVEQFQQTVKNALSNIKGSGGVTERAKARIASMDLDVKEFLSKYTGDINAVPIDHPIIKHLINISELATKDLQDQVNNQIDFQSQKNLKGTIEKAKEAGKISEKSIPTTSKKIKPEDIAKMTDEQVKAYMGVKK
jgi:hypothetical protein